MNPRSLNFEKVNPKRYHGKRLTWSPAFEEDTEAQQPLLEVEVISKRSVEKVVDPGETILHPRTIFRMWIWPPIQDDVISEAEFVVEKIAKVFSVHRRFPVDL